MTQLSQTKAEKLRVFPRVPPLPLPQWDTSCLRLPATLALLYFYTLFVCFCFCDCSRKAAAVRFSPVLLPGVLWFQLPCRCCQASTSACRVIRHVCRSAHVVGWSQRFLSVHMCSIFSLSQSTDWVWGAPEKSGLWSFHQLNFRSEAGLIRAQIKADPRHSCVLLRPTSPRSLFPRPPSLSFSSPNPRCIEQHADFFSLCHMYDFPVSFPLLWCATDYPECLYALASLRSAEFAFTRQKEGGKQRGEKRTKQRLWEVHVGVCVCLSVCLCVGGCT